MHGMHASVLKDRQTLTHLPKMILLQLTHHDASQVRGVTHK
jgi:hypothetical protein